MKFSWLPFTISIKDFDSFLKKLTPLYDGLICDSEGYIIPNYENFQEEHKILINDYLTNLNELDEIAKIRLPNILISNLELIKTDMLSKAYTNLNTTEKKIILNIPLDETDEMYILTYTQKKSIIDKIIETFTN